MKPALLCLALPLTLPSKARAAELFEGMAYYVGDPHVHTGISGDGHSSDLESPSIEGCGAFSEVFNIAQANGLDWLALSDHTTGLATATYEDWMYELAFVLDHDDSGTGLVVIPAAEMTVDIPEGALGHRNVYFFGTDAELAELTITDTRPEASASHKITDCSVVWTWLDSITETYGDVLFFPHHPYGLIPAPMDYSCHDPNYEKAIEIYSAWGLGLGDWSGYDLPSTGIVANGAVHHAMDPASFDIHFGFLGGTDSHYTTPGDLCSELSARGYHVSTGGLTMLAVPEGETWDRSAVHRAIVERRSLAISGPPVPMAVEFHSDGTLLATLGQDFHVATGADLETRVRVPLEWAPSVTAVYLTSLEEHWELEPFSEAEWRVTLPAASVPRWVYASALIDGELALGDFYCDDFNDTTDEWVWASPSWIVVDPPDGDGDSFRTVDGDCDDTTPLVYPGAPETVGNGIDEDCDGGDTCHLDADLDGYRTESTILSLDLDCEDPNEATPLVPDNDCDDLDPEIHPGADELCDGVDNDCDAEIDGVDSLDTLPWYPDSDGDGYPVQQDIYYACEPPSGHLAAGPWDCDDSNPNIHPLAEEIANDSIDQDCDTTDLLDNDLRQVPVDYPSPQDQRTRPVARACLGCSSIRSSPGAAWLAALLVLAALRRRAT